MQRRAVLTEQPANLGEDLKVAAVGESRDTNGTPGTGSHQPALCRTAVARAPGGMPARRAGVGAQGMNRGCDHVRRRGDDFHMARRRQAGGLRGNLQRLVPAPGVDVRPPEDKIASTAFRHGARQSP